MLSKDSSMASANASEMKCSLAVSVPLADLLNKGLTSPDIVTPFAAEPDVGMSPAGVRTSAVEPGATLSPVDEMTSADAADMLSLPDLMMVSK